MGDDNKNAATDVPQKLMSAEEVYVYKIPPLTSSGGHRAEDWNLASPLKTCSLKVEQRGKILYVLFEHTPDETNTAVKAVFAMSKIDMASKTPSPSLEYFVEGTVDSSRYFAVRITDEKSGRDAWIGFGFRDRDEATDFRESLQFYIKSIKREHEAAAGGGEELKKYDAMGHNLSLKEGEKIHVQLHGKSTISGEASETKKKKSSAGGAVPLLLKKPPPPGSPFASSGSKTPPPSENAGGKTPVQGKPLKDVSISFGEINLDDHSVGTDESDSTGAVGGLSTDGDEAWKDFEGETF